MRQQRRKAIQDILADTTLSVEERHRRVAAMRSKAVSDHFSELQDEPGKTVYSNGVAFRSVTPIQDGGRMIGVEIHTGPSSAETNFRIINPPTLVLDPLGPIEVRGQKYREDPLAAVASVIRSTRADQSKGRLR